MEERFSRTHGPDCRRQHADLKVERIGPVTIYKRGQTYYLYYREQEFGGRPVRAGESFSAAFVVGFFDSIEEMQQVYDEYKGAVGLDVSENGWKLVP